MTKEEALSLKVWALVGATPKKEKFGYKIFKCLEKHGYKVYPVHPAVATIDDHMCYKSIEDIPEKVEIVNLVIPESAGLKVLEQCKKLGINTLWLQPGADTPAILRKGDQLGLQLIQGCVLVELDEE